MKGLEISESFWKEYGLPMMEERFPDLLPKVAVGLIGPGSECYGFDDEISRDHDFEHGFCIFLPGEDMVDRRAEFLLERAYDKLPKEYMGLRRASLNPAGGNRHGVIRTEDFFENVIGHRTAPESFRDFLALPEYALAEIANGKIFYDGSGDFTNLRKKWTEIPRDVVLKKLCGYLISMSQAGEYNYPRCLARSELSAARLTATEFVKSVVGAVFWAFGRPVPYYKWSFRAMKELNSEICADLEEILDRRDASELIPKVCESVLKLIDERDILRDTNVRSRANAGNPHLMSLQHLNEVQDKTPVRDLQHVAMTLNDAISDSELRNLGLLSAV